MLESGDPLPQYRFTKETNEMRDIFSGIGYKKCFILIKIKYKMGNK